MQSAEAWGNCNGTNGSGADTTGPSAEEGPKEDPQAIPDCPGTMPYALRMEWWESSPPRLTFSTCSASSLLWQTRERRRPEDDPECLRSHHFPETLGQRLESSKGEVSGWERWQKSPLSLATSSEGLRKLGHAETTLNLSLDWTTESPRSHSSCPSQTDEPGSRCSFPPNGG